MALRNTLSMFGNYNIDQSKQTEASWT